MTDARITANLLLDNITDINVGNMLKMSERFKLKETDKGFEISEFFEEFMLECFERITKCDDNVYYAECAQLAISYWRKYKEDTRINVLHLLDAFLFDLRNISL